MLIGRKAEIETCLEHISDARPLAVLADAGIGKTALLQATAAECKRRTFIGRGLGTLSWVSYLSLEHALGVKLPDGDLPSIASVVTRRVGDGVLVLDDLQWVDGDTLNLLPFLRGQIRLLGAVRTDDPGAERARAALEEARFAVHELGPLNDDESEALLRARRPDLSLVALRNIVRHAGGNPLLLEELLVGGEPSRTLRISMAARLRRLSRPARRALGVLSLLERPAGHELVGAGLEELVRSGLVVETPEGFGLRHALLAEAAAGQLSERERKRVHAEIASKTSDLGEAALHHHLAGDHTAARRDALLAAERTERIGQRARLLSIAAQTGGTEVADDEIRLRAAEALIEAGEYEQARSIASAVRPTTPEVATEALLHQARAALGMQSFTAARSLARDGLTLVDGSGTLVEIRLRLEDLKVALWLWEYDSAGPAAREALALATGTVEEIQARIILGSILAMGSPEGISHLEKALEDARRSEDFRLECDAAFLLISALRMVLRWREALHMARQMRVRSIAAGLRSREVQFTLEEMLILLDAVGDLERGIQLGMQLIDDPAVPERSAQDVIGALAIALLAAGRVDEARGVLERTGPEGGHGSVIRLIAMAELEGATGKPERVVEIADSTVELFPRDVNVPILWIARAWACLELGQDIDPFPCSVHPCMDHYRSELNALSSLRKGDLTAAVKSFLEASGRARDREAGAELRCSWAAGDTAARAGDTPRAKRLLLEVEERARALGMNRLLARIHASLRSIGVRRSAPRSGRVGGLSAREREVLGLVATGHRSRDIALQLGIASSTVDSIVRSAMTKLGAQTRIEAAERARVSS